MSRTLHSRCDKRDYNSRRYPGYTPHGRLSKRMTHRHERAQAKAFIADELLEEARIERGCSQSESERIDFITDDFYRYVWWGVMSF